MSCEQVLHDRSLVIGDPVVSLHADLAPVPQSAGQARALIASVLSDGAGRMLMSDVVFDAQLVASELVTNAVLHARTSIQLGIYHDDHSLLITVADGAPAARVMERADLPGTVVPDGESGRGIAIVATLSDDFGWRQRTETVGKIMWALIELDGR